MTLVKNKDLSNPKSSLLERNDQYIQLGTPEICRPAVLAFDTKDKITFLYKVEDPLFTTLYGTNSYFVYNNETVVAYWGFKTSTCSSKIEVQVIKF